MAFWLRVFTALALLAVSAVIPTRASIIQFSGTLAADQVVAGSTSTATGFALVSIDTTLFTITTDLSWSGLSGPADRAHLHSGPEGQPTDGIFFHEVLGLFDDSPTRTVACPWDTGSFTNCVPSTGFVEDVLQLDATDGYGFADFASLVAAFFQDGVFIDMHTELFPDGEIRTQLLPVSVPEPSILSLLLCPLLLVSGSRWRKFSNLSKA
jgi:hypothetical protein